MANRSRLAAFRGSAAAVAIIATGLGGCQTATSLLATGSTFNASGARAEAADARDTGGRWAERYKANPKDAEAALRYAEALRASGQRTQAAAVLEQATIANPGDRALLAAYGRALADVGNFQLAFDVLGRAHTPDNPDWRILSVQGAALDQLGRHGEARRYYSSALKIAPEEPTVLSNLGLSYALSKELPQAESTLRRAMSKGSSDPRVRQNLALVVGLQGRFDEAESIARADLPPEDAAANVAYLRQMLNRMDDPRQPRNAARAATAGS